jgi:hypothetical protein
MDIKELLKWTFGICAAAITIYKFFWKAPSEKEAKQVEEKAENIATRFIALFESHGVHRNQIPEFFDHGLDISSCASDDELLNNLTPEIITDAVKLFGVNKDWLEGSTKEIYDIPNFYKHPERFESYIIELVERTEADKLSASALIADKRLMNIYSDSLFVIAEPIGEINHRQIYKYHLVGDWGIHYWKSRAYFTACCALLYKYGLLVTGKYVESDWLSKVCEGQKLLNYDFVGCYGGVDFPMVGSWKVPEFIEIPDEYLKDLNTKDGHSVNLALGMWLSLSEKGYMRCFPEDEKFHAGVEAEFNKKLEELA